MAIYVFRQQLRASEHPSRSTFKAIDEACLGVYARCQSSVGPFGSAPSFSQKLPSCRYLLIRFQWYYHALLAAFDP